MLDLFQIEQNGVVFRPEALAIKEFRVLWNRDKTKDKKKAFLEMSFIFLTEDLRSPFKTYPVDEREAQVIRSVFEEEKWKPDKLVEAARERYRSLTNSRSMVLLNDTWKSMDEMGKFLRDTQINSPKDASSMKGVYKDMPAVILALKKMEDEVRKELENTGTLKGGREKAFFEDPNKRL